MMDETSGNDQSSLDKKQDPKSGVAQPLEEHRYCGEQLENNDGSVSQTVETEKYVDKASSLKEASYVGPQIKAIPSLDAVDVLGDRLTFSVSSLVGRYWNGMVVMSEICDKGNDVTQLNIMSSCVVPAGLADIKFIRNTGNLLVGHDDGCVSVMSVTSNDNKEEASERLQMMNYAIEHDSCVIRVAVNSTSDGGASLENDGRVKLWLFDPFISLNTFKAFPFRAHDMTFHPKRRGLLATCGDTCDTLGSSTHRSLSLWSVRESSCATFAASVGGVKCTDSRSAFTAMSWSPVDDDWIFAGDRQGNVYLYDIRKLDDHVVMMPKVHRNGCVELIASRGSHIFSIGSDRRLAVREIFADEDGLARERAVFGDGFLHSSAPRGLAVHPGGTVWTSDVSGQLWCHQLPKDGSTKKIKTVKCCLNPDLQSIEF